MPNTDQPIQFIAWDADRVPSYFPDLAGLARWAQMRQLTTVDVWQVNDAEGKIERRWISRTDAWWDLRDALDQPLGSVIADPSEDPRTLAVVDFAETTMAVLVTPVRVLPDDWDPADPADELGVYARFGYLPPTFVAGEWLWPYCPDLIADQTRHLDDDWFAGYLAQMDMRVGMHTVLVDQTAEQREREISVALYNAGPELNGAVNEVHMKALDS